MMTEQKEKAYIVIYDELKQRILSGRIERGEKLPSKRQLSDDFGVSLITIEHSLSLLADEGFIEPIERSGYFVIYRRGDSFESSKVPAAYSYSANNTDDTGLNFSLYSRMMRKTAADHQEDILKRSPNRGLEYLREAISSYLYKNRDIEVSADQIIIGAGAEYLYGIITLLIGKDKLYGIENPSYEQITAVYRANDINIRLLKLGMHGVQSDELWKNDFDVLHVSPYRSFPSGISADASKIREYIRWAKTRKGRYIIEDDFESEFYPASKPAETIFQTAEESGGNKNVIYMNTFSKTISPSIRTGYMILPKNLISKYEKNAGFYSCAVPTFEQYLIAELIESGEFAKNINRIRRKRKSLL